MFCRRVVKSVAVFVIILAAAWLSLGTSPASEPAVEIVRDAWGIPHIFATTDAAAMYGLGYATAQDRMLQMEYSRRIVQGRIAEMLGIVGARGKTTLDSDIKYRTMQTYAYLETIIERLDADTRQLLQAYADGVNHYLETSDSLSPLFETYGITPDPWRPVDCLAVWNRIAAFFSPSWTGEAKLLHEYEDLLAGGRSEQKAIDELTNERILDEAAAVVQLSDVDPDFLEALDAYVAGLAQAPRDVPEAVAAEVIPSFSHAWVVGGTRTTTGSAVLHSDPQTTVRNPSVWYEAHVEGATFNARGIGVAGCPGFLIGWNETVAWGATALGADLADTFRLELPGTRRNTYEYDGVEKPIETHQEEIAVRGGRATTISVRSTTLGPVVSELMTDRRANEEYVLQTVDQEAENRHTVQALFAMMRAHDVYEFSDAIAGWISPGIHSLFGDASGHIGYWTLADIPVRSSESPFGGQASQDGSSSTAGWLDIIPHALLPHVLDPSAGLLFSANHLPVGDWYPLALGVGTGGSGDSQRSWRLRELLAGDRIFTPEDVLAVHYDTVSSAIRTILRAGCRAESHGQRLSASAGRALDILRDWYARGAHCESTEPYFAAAYHIARGFRQPQAGDLYDRYGGGEGGLCFFLKDLSARLDANPNLLLDPAELAYIDASLAAGWDTAVARYGTDPAQWQARFSAATAVLALPYGVNLEGFSTLARSDDLESEPLLDPEGTTILSQRADSYSQWVDLFDVDQSRALLPIGISEDPGSAYYAAEKELWEAGTLRAAPLSRAACEEIADTFVWLDVP